MKSQEERKKERKKKKMELNSSGSDSDDFAEDMEALKRACLLTTTTNNNNTNLHLPPSTFDSDSSCNSEDEELIRKMRERFGQAPLNLKPICSLPPADNNETDDDSDDDLLILQAIQRRFSDYTITPSSSAAVSDSMRKSIGDDGGGGCLHKPPVGSIDIDSDKETSNNLYSGKTSTAQGFLDSVDECVTTRVSDDDDDGGGGSDKGKPGFVSVADSVLSSPVRDCSSFPKSALAFLDAIKKNRTCQKYIRSKLMQIEARIEENSKLNESVKTLKGLQVSCRRRTGRALSQKKDDRLLLIEVPKLRANAKPRANGKKRGKKKNVMYYGPAENSHVANYRTVLSKIPVSFDRKKWTPAEDENIEKGIKQQFQDTLLQKSYRKKEPLHQQLDGLSSDEEGLYGSSNDFDNIIESIGDIHITAENMRVFLPKVNWEQLASMYVAGRTGAECEARWLNFKDPLINKGPWGKLEEKNLLHIVQQKGFSNWIDIAVSLGTNRTPFQCLAHYQRSLNASILKKAWTKDEDDKLRSAVELYGEHDWQLVAAALVGRTGTQCSNRWNKTLNPMREREGTWTSHETKHLKVAVMLFGAKNWQRIAQYVPGRTKEGCAERWNNCLKPSLKRGDWSECEDSMLEAAAEQNRIKWGKVEWFKVAACIPQRTDSQCMRRFKILFPNKFRLIQEAKKVENVALMSNFVDREARRPEIGPDDFVSLKMIDLPETEDIDSPRKKKKSRSKRCSKDPGIPPAGELGSEIINLSVTDGISKKKRGRKVSVDDRLSSRCNLVPPLSAPMLLTNGEELRADVGTITAKNNAPGIQKKRGKRKSDIADTSSRHVPLPVKKGTRKPSSRDDPASQIVEDQGMEAMKNRKASKPPLRKGRCSEQLNDVQSNRISDGRLNKLIGVKSRGKSCLNQTPNTEYVDDSTLASFIEKSRKSKKSASSPAKLLKIPIMGGTNTKTSDASENMTVHPSCSTSEIGLTWSSSASVVGAEKGSKRLRVGSKTIPDQMSGAEYEDDMTLSSTVAYKKREAKVAKFFDNGLVQMVKSKLRLVEVSD